MVARRPFHHMISHEHDAIIKEGYSYKYNYIGGIEEVRNSPIMYANDEIRLANSLHNNLPATVFLPDVTSRLDGVL